MNIESQQGMNSSVENLHDLKLRRLLADFHHSGKGAFLMRKWSPATRTKCKILHMTPLVMLHNSVLFGVTYEKIGTIQRRLAWPLHKDDTLSRSGRSTDLNIYFAICVIFQNFCRCSLIYGRKMPSKCPPTSFMHNTHRKPMDAK